MRMCTLPGKLVGATGTAQLLRGRSDVLRLSLHVTDALAQDVASETKHHREGQIFTHAADGIMLVITPPLGCACVSEHLSLYDQRQREQQAEE